MDVFHMHFDCGNVHFVWCGTLLRQVVGPINKNKKGFKMKLSSS